MIDVVVGDQGPVREPLQRLTPENEPLKRAEPEEEPPRRRTGPESDEKQGGFWANQPLIVFLLAMLLYIFLFIASANEKYIDFGDGNYLYISWRLTEGELLYQEIPNPQPPLHLFIGASLLWLTGGDPVLIRIFQLLLHTLTACCVWGISKRIFRWNEAAALGGIIYLFLPEGVWWATGYQSEPLMIFLQSFNLLLLLDAIKRERSGGALVMAALLMVFCCFTNMTALPYLFLQWFFIAYLYRPLLRAYSITLLSAGFVFFALMMIYTNGTYWYHIFVRQVGTYPHDSLGETLSYFASKLYTEGGDVLNFEGGFVLCAIIGLMLSIGDNRQHPGRGYTLWWAIFSLGSIIFVTKGGTVDYIFTIGEPAVAVFSGYFILTMFLASSIPENVSERERSALFFGKATLIATLFLPVMLMRALFLLWMTFSSSSGPRGLFELSAEEVQKTTAYIQRTCPNPAQEILSPPYYAFMAQRKITENACELFVLAHSYFNEWDDFVEFLKEENEKANGSPDSLPEFLNLPRMSDLRFQPIYEAFDISRAQYVTQQIYDLAVYFEQNPELRERYPSIALFLDIRQNIREGRVSLILMNTRHLFFFVPPLHQAIRDYCTPSDFQLNLPTREESIMVFRPKPRV